MQKLTVIECEKDSPFVEPLEALFQQSWADFTFLKSDAFSSNLPPVFAALIGEKLAGGLSFTRHQAPNSEHDAIWVNALYVLPEYRTNGIARTLLKSAERHAAKLGYSRLYAYTNVSYIYLSNGWKISETSSSSDHHVVHFQVRS
ncbi:putative Acyl-CoA N-acyltransferase [Vibrio nigripulchritudo MADA3029]|uniref:GNAT family N-acetyltransferase n=1 Tax=Vibrio nigripulchritudo TaxID=28173 RepID=UPI0003B19BC8|nr:GNAT family N-acetyltransferase [Vibrio nigripulchritudo]CCN50188.1 putative Acyl-CoA N-acyltransferase [Vibrio nigripulchritudo MADA3020]CCN51184.1 putative Acyl-CoA N-acyltransferase [Vibrio nigripulchritudo MADA3021]CCN56842.1 putative Acyl-CoA N-acyltransferase [Vibrio nigripulchritudo MADA3029]